MAEVVLFHHVQGLTDGVRAFAAELRAGGHAVHTPDLFEGERPATIDDGVAYLQSVGDEALGERADRAVARLPEGLVYAGFSWGGSVAQRFAQTRPGARGALLYESCIPITGEWAFGPWPDGVPVQIHGMDNDPFFGLEGDIDAARELVEIVGPKLAELFVYPGDQHLFTDSALPSYDADAAALVLQRSLSFLDRIGLSGDRSGRHSTQPTWRRRPGTGCSPSASPTNERRPSTGNPC
jgi:dienelactone hydrolase